MVIRTFFQRTTEYASLVGRTRRTKLAIGSSAGSAAT